MKTEVLDLYDSLSSLGVKVYINEKMQIALKKSPTKKDVSEPPKYLMKKAANFTAGVVLLTEYRARKNFLKTYYALNNENKRVFYNTIMDLVNLSIRNSKKTR